MSDDESHRSTNVGCALFALVALGLIVGLGMWFGKRDNDSKTPCEKYAEVAGRVLYNCHSGQAKDAKHHTAVCEELLDPTPACLERLENLTCDELQLPPEIATGAACRANEK